MRNKRAIAHGWLNRNRALSSIGVKRDLKASLSTAAIREIKLLSSKADTRELQAPISAAVISEIKGSLYMPF